MSIVFWWHRTATLKRSYDKPDFSISVTDWQRQCDLFWSYYVGSMFDKFEQNMQLIGKYTTDYELYKHTRFLINPVKRLVDFWVSAIYPGVLSNDGESLDEGLPLAIPLSSSTDIRLKASIGQLWSWSNFQAMKSIITRYGASLGSLLVEIIDDVPAGKVSFNVPYPGYVYDVVLDTMGNVKAYTIMYPSRDQNGPFWYKKVVTGRTISHFRNDEPYDILGPGTAQVEHGYTFCPAVWIKHVDYGSLFGQPAISGSISKIDEINSILSHANDLVHKLIESPIIFWTDGQIKNAMGAVLPNNNGTGSTAFDDFGPGLSAKTTKSSMLILKGPYEGKMDTLAPKVELDNAFKQIDLLMQDINHTHPEITYYQDLRSMSQLSGTAVNLLTGDVGTRVQEVAPNYDRQLVKLFQMSTAIAGQRSNDGSWESFGTLNSQQLKFKPFDLNSYKKGDLDLSIKPRPLVKLSQVERSAERVAYWTGVEAAVAAGEDIATVLREDGFSEERIKVILANRDKKSSQPVIPTQTSQQAIGLQPDNLNPANNAVQRQINNNQ